MRLSSQLPDPGACPDAARQPGCDAISKPEDVTAKHAEVVIVRLPGELDLASEPAAAAELMTAIAAGLPVVLADLTGTTFMDSLGAGMLYHAYLEGGRQGIDVRFAISHRAVLRVLEMMGHSQVLGIYPSLSAALAARALPGS